MSTKLRGESVIWCAIAAGRRIPCRLGFYRMRHGYPAQLVIIPCGMRLPGDEAPWRALPGAHSGNGTGAHSIAQHVATGYTCCNMLHTNVAT